MSGTKRRMATAAMQTNTLLQMLDLRGWAGVQLSKGARAALRGLAACLPYRSGQGYATRDQICERMGYRSQRHVGTLLHELEAAGLIEWTRGRPGRAGLFRICKDVLAGLCNAAVAPHVKRVQEMRAKTRERVGRWRYVRMRTNKPRALIEFDQLGQGQSASVQGAKTAHLFPLRGESLRGSHPGPVFRSTATPQATPSKENNVQRLPEINPMYLSQTCRHKDPRGPRYCALCRAQAMSPEQWAEWEAEHGPHNHGTDSTPSKAREDALAIMRAVAAKAMR